MTSEEYNEKLAEIKKEAENKKRDLNILYAKEQRKFKIGDIIKSPTWGTIIIDRITAYKGFELPMPVYSGIALTKKLEVKKSKERASIYGNKNVALIKEA